MDKTQNPFHSQSMQYQLLNSQINGIKEENGFTLDELEQLFKVSTYQFQLTKRTLPYPKLKKT
jgi:hypothetical protein